MYDYLDDRQTKRLKELVPYEVLAPDADEIIEELDRLNKEYERIYNENCKLREEHNITDIKLLDENNRLKNIIDELEKWIEDNLGNCRTNQNYTSNQIYNLKEDTYYRCLDKLKALKEE